jgi:hypothetical protein
MECKMLWQKWFKSSIMVIGVMSLIAGASGATDSTRVVTPGPAKLQASHISDTAIDTSQVFVLVIKHRIFTKFNEVDTVHFNEKFPIGEGDYVGQVFVFNPHLSITDKGEYLQVSDTLYNPAVRVRVYQKDSVIQESWAFYYSDAPHFRRSDMLGFKLASFQVSDKFVKADGPQILAPRPADSTSKSK